MSSSALTLTSPQYPTHKALTKLTKCFEKIHLTETSAPLLPISYHNQPNHLSTLFPTKDFSTLVTNTASTDPVSHLTIVKTEVTAKLIRNTFENQTTTWTTLTYTLERTIFSTCWHNMLFTLGKDDALLLAYQALHMVALGHYPQHDQDQKKSPEYLRDLIVAISERCGITPETCFQIPSIHFK